MAQMTELNKAIYKVITTQYKKDAREAHEMVEAAGYEIEKWAGVGFVVKNPATGRTLYISEHKGYGRHGWYTTILHFSKFGCGKHIRQFNELNKFDFQSALDKPENEAYYAQKRMEQEMADGANRWNGKVQQLKDARWSVSYENRELERLQKQLAEIQRSIIKAAADKAKAEMRLAEVKQSLGLRK